MSEAVVKLFLIFTFIATSHSEPICSKFANEEQLLEKMVRMEFNVGQMENEIKTTNKFVQEALQQLKENLDKLSVDYQGMKEEHTKKENEIDLKLEKYKELLSIHNIAFKARSPSTLDPVDDAVIVFTKILVNAGDAYNNRTGVFTAPTDGTYLFTCQICLGVSKWMTVGIFIDDVLQIVARNSDNYPCFNIETTAAMSAGQTALVKSWGTSDGRIMIEQDTKRWNVFAGTLIHI